MNLLPREIRNRLLLVPALGLFFLVGSGVFSGWQSIRQTARQQRVEQVSQQRLRLQAQSRSQMEEFARLQQILNWAGLGVAGNRLDSLAEASKTSLSQRDSWLEDSLGSIVGGDSLKVRSNAFHGSALQVLDMVDADPAVAMGMLEPSFRKLASLQASISRADSALEMEVAVARREAESSLVFAAWLNAVACLVSVILLGGVGWWITRTLVGPVQEVIQGVHRIAQGELGGTIPVRSQDEIGQIAQALGEAKEALRSTFGRTSENSRLLDEGAGGLHRVALRVGEATASLGASMGELNHAAQELASESRNVAEG
ncbi:MAG TPA: methyl-accepting chemotaxis protein, partial [Fibrobacteria bacterium]|nr:methyl-accepting chemotaxis protein [Fibrobacteria bacterium]